MYLSSKVRIINDAEHEKRDNIHTWVSWVHSLIPWTYIWARNIYLQGLLAKKFYGMGRIRNWFKPFPPVENAFPNPVINSSHFRKEYLKFGHSFPQFIHTFKIRISKCWSWAVYNSRFFQFQIHKKDERLGFFKSPCLHILSDGEDSLSVQHVA